MNMAPEAFWGQTVREWSARIAGFSEMHGGGGDDAPLTRAELFALAEEYPDTPSART